MSHAAGSAPPVTSIGPASSAASSAAVTSPPVSSAPVSGSPDPCLDPVDEKAGSVPVLDPGADSVLVCHPGAVAGRGGPVTLSGNDATNIGKLLDLAPQGTATCLYKPDVLLRFEFRGPPQQHEDVEISSVGCDHPIASVAGHTWLIPPKLAEYLSTDAISPAAKDDSPPIPDATGLSLAEATQVITRAGMTIASDDRVTDPLLSPGTVVLQDPPAGAGMIGSTTEVDVLLSQQPAPACSLSQLAFDYHGVQYGTGDAFSDLDVRDIGATPCTLTGPVSVVGVDAGGNSVTNRLTLPVAADLVLTAKAPPRAAGEGAPKNAVIAWIPLEADARGPDGSCTSDVVLPTDWSVTIAGSATAVPNGAGAAEPPMSSCGGQLLIAPNPAAITPLN